MLLFITIDMLHRFHHYCIQFLPNEVFALLVGSQIDRDICVTNFVHPRIVHASESHVLADWEDVFRKAEQYYTVGFVHTHPDENSTVRMSKNDVEFHKYMAERFLKQFGRRPYFLIYAPYPGIFAIYDETKPFTDYQIIQRI